MLKGKIGSVGGEKPKEGEKGLPEEGPMVVETSTAVDKVCKEAMDERYGGDVEGEVEAATEVVI